MISANTTRQPIKNTVFSTLLSVSAWSELLINEHSYDNDNNKDNHGQASYQIYFVLKKNQTN